MHADWIHDGITGPVQHPGIVDRACWSNGIERIRAHGLHSHCNIAASCRSPVCTSHHLLLSCECVWLSSSCECDEVCKRHLMPCKSREREREAWNLSASSAEVCRSFCCTSTAVADAAAALDCMTGVTCPLLAFENPIWHRRNDARAPGGDTGCTVACAGGTGGGTRPRADARPTGTEVRASTSPGGL